MARKKKNDKLTEVITSMGAVIVGAGFGYLFGLIGIAIAFGAWFLYSKLTKKKVK